MENKILNIEEIKNIFLQSNFFDWTEEDKFDIFYNSDKEYDEILKENFFDKIKYKDGDFVIELSPMHFLHGRCCEFAIALARKFGYKIIINFDYNEEGNFLKLIHAYCISNNNNNIELIDVRGVYSKYNTPESFISDNEFEYSWDYNADLELNIDEAIEFLSKNLKIAPSTYDDLEEANKIIELFEEKYSI